MRTQRVTAVIEGLDDPGAGILGAVFGAIGFAGFLLVILLAWELIMRKEGMGMGDVKLCLLLGAMLGRNVPVAIAIAGLLWCTEAALAAAQP